MSDPEFLTLDDVIAIHADQIATYGGAAGIRDEDLLRSSIAMPKSTLDGNFLHTNLLETAAAYLFHIARNHPFLDGNKRTGLMSALVFLGRNGRRVDADPDELYSLVDGVAAGHLGKSDVSALLDRTSTER